MSDPRTKFVQPPFPEQKNQKYPGSEKDLNPKPNYGRDEYKGNGKLKGKVALITGGDSGIGRAVAYTFACEGADVAISYLSENQDAAETKKAVESVGRQCLTFEGDIQDSKLCQEIVDKTIKKFGRLDVLVNNAAYQMSVNGFEDMTDELLDQTFRTNIMSMFYFVRAAWPHLKPGSSILNTTSVQAYAPSPQLMPYATTKAAIANFTKSLAQMGAEKGVRVNAVAPGPIWTPLNPATSPPERVKKFGEQSWLERAGQPIEVANVFVFLASEQASYVTGHIYGVTGGMEMGLI